MTGGTTDGTHGFGFGVTGAQLRALIAARGLCPGCAGTRRRWSLRTRASVACAVCSGGTLAMQANGTGAASATIAVRTFAVAIAGEALAAA